MKIEPRTEIDSEEVLTVEFFFLSETLRMIFHKFLAQNWQQIETLYLEDDCDHQQMLLEVKSDLGISRKIVMNFNGQRENRELKTYTTVDHHDSASVLQVVLLFMGSHNYPQYNLEPQSNSRLALCCSKKVAAIIDEHEFYDLIINLANTADRLENAIHSKPQANRQTAGQTVCSSKIN